MLSTILCWTLLAAAEGLRAYDCKHKDVEQTVINTKMPGDCPDPRRDFTHPKEEEFQLIQTGTDAAIQAYVCRIVATKSVTYCGHWARPSAHYGSLSSAWHRTEEVTAEECWDAVKTGKIQYYGRTWEAKMGTPNTAIFFSHGSLNGDGECTVADSFVSNGIRYKHSYEQVQAVITIQAVGGLIRRTTGKVLLDNGLAADSKDGTLWDVHKGRMVWPVGETSHCETFLTSVYQGLGEVRARKGYRARKDSFVITNRNNTDAPNLGLILSDPVIICNKRCHTVSSLDGFAVCFYDADGPLFPDAGFQILSREHATSLGHADTKAKTDFGILDRHLSSEQKFERLSRDVCETRRRGLFNKLQAISGGGNPHALLDIYGPGYLVTPAGSAAAYVTKCVEVEVRRARWGNCTAEVPVIPVATVTGGGEIPTAEPSQEQGDWTAKAFMDPNSLILKDYPMELPCSKDMPVLWELDGDWLCSHTHGTINCPEPQKVALDLDPSHQSAQFLVGMKGVGFMMPEQKKLRDEYMDMSTHREAATARTVQNMVSNGREHRLGSALNGADILGAGNSIMGYLATTWLFIICNTYIQFLLTFITIGTLIWNTIAAFRRIYVEYMLHGWDEGRTALRAFYALFNIVGIPFRRAINFVMSMSDNERQELRRRMDEQAILARELGSEAGFPGTAAGLPGLRGTTVNRRGRRGGSRPGPKTDTTSFTTSAQPGSSDTNGRSSPPEYETDPSRANTLPRARGALGGATDPDRVVLSQTQAWRDYTAKPGAK